MRNPVKRGGIDRAFAVDRLTERIDDATDEGVADGDLGDVAGPFDLVAFADFGVGAEDRDTDIVGFEVQHHSVDIIGELHQLGHLDIFQTPDAGNTVTDLQHGADRLHLEFGFEPLELLSYDR